MKNFLIVGQGAAGSFLAWELLKRGQQVTVVDNEHKSSSSMVSAGIINPITGKRFAMTEDFDPFFAYALKTYRELEAQFDQQFFESLDILRVFQDSSEHDHWKRKVRLNEGQQYSKQTNLPKTFHAAIKDPLGSVVITQSGFCHTARLLTALKNYFQDRGILALQEFCYDDLSINEGGVHFGGELFETVIFCEGYKAQWNPWFDWIPYNSVKGEILKIATKEPALPRMIINKGKWCAPLDGEEWIAGSSYIWDQLDCEPTDEGHDQIVCGLNQCFSNVIKVIDHKAGVRPVIKDQKAVIGRHPKHPNLAIFNGLGSKGFLTAPLYASHFADHLSEGSPLRSDIAPSRFDN